MEQKSGRREERNMALIYCWHDFKRRREKWKWKRGGE